MDKKDCITLLVPRIGKNPKRYLLTPAEHAIMPSLRNCLMEQSHFIAEYCHLQPATIEMLLRYAKLNKTTYIEDCAKDLGLIFNRCWHEPHINRSAWLSSLPKLAKYIFKDIESEFVAWKEKNY
ncbi:MAG: hypothetical protein COW84_06855 [Gammaproteobacteria bacterium CG22_combo_CG10-13_8_21_14_all_40_8]|nr:MAG: hypothetical protein COW84_06855 [Gammaproteobacteria bacterium CG22_combo_CG10-13_8_21_14_all_40_8]